MENPSLRPVVPKHCGTEQAQWGFLKWFLMPTCIRTCSLRAYPECMGAGLHTWTPVHLDMDVHVVVCHRMGTQLPVLLQAPCPGEAQSPTAKKRRHETRACMKAGSAKGRTSGQEVTENFQEAAEAKPDRIAHTRCISIMK